MLEQEALLGRMKKPDIGQTVAILANIGVIAGIVFLAYELQQNNRFLAAQARSDMRASRVSYNELLMTPEITRVVVKATNNEELNAEESFRLERLHRSMFVNWEAEYREYEEGMYGLEELPVEGYREAFTYMPGLLNAWQRNKHVRDPDFVQFVEENVVNER